MKTVLERRTRIGKHFKSNRKLDWDLTNEDGHKLLKAYRHKFPYYASHLYGAKSWNYKVSISIAFTDGVPPTSFVITRSEFYKVLGYRPERIRLVNSVKGNPKPKHTKKAIVRFLEREAV